MLRIGKGICLWIPGDGERQGTVGVPLRLWVGRYFGEERARGFAEPSGPGLPGKPSEEGSPSWRAQEPALEDPCLIVVLIYIVLNAVRIGISLGALSPMHFLFYKSPFFYGTVCLFPIPSTLPGEPDS